jgi:hypothetical protein
VDSSEVITYLRTKEEFYNREVLCAFVEGLAAQGHYVAGEDWRKVRRVWMATLNGESSQADSPQPESVFTPGVSSVLLDDIETFVEDRSDLLAVYLFSTARDGDLKAFEATIYLESEEYTLTMSMLANPDVLAPFLHWLDILQFTYETWHPLYSYKEGGIGETTYEDALAGNITELYSMNLLNREMVEKLGRERVINTPAWHMTELANGSVFLIPELIYDGGQGEDYRYDTKAAAAHLGLRAY